MKCDGINRTRDMVRKLNPVICGTQSEKLFSSPVSVTVGEQWLVLCVTAVLTANGGGIADLLDLLSSVHAVLYVLMLFLRLCCSLSLPIHQQYRPVPMEH